MIKYYQHFDVIDDGHHCWVAYVFMLIVIPNVNPAVYAFRLVVEYVAKFTLITCSTNNGKEPIQYYTCN